eukprot:CAMPEP_0114241434 /NCGR_PEP_ID=MMETSP0058-20121206/9629_1 /TAXON_ID=36894 /ORGANISM="Pyramimonas parkeae, CCMP726" /LENGTH=188 /DNA_ID=CAMNT_0001353957 /DNA_START=51 /DNA_END=617 /DNA_ORIENTATION=-
MASYYTVLDSSADAAPFFRQVEPGDVARIAALEAAGYPEDEAASLEIITARSREASGCFLVAIKPGATGDQLIGFVNGTLAKGSSLKHETMSVHDPDGELLCIHSVCVEDTHRRKKVGTRLLKAYLAYISQSTPQATRIALICKENLVGFYSACGFKMVGPSSVVHGKDKWFEMNVDVRDESCNDVES